MKAFVSDSTRRSPRRESRCRSIVVLGMPLFRDQLRVAYPTMLDFPAPVLQAYPKETVVAEKLEALTALGVLNSRMKDYYDLALLSRMYPFERRHKRMQSPRPFATEEQQLRPSQLASLRRTTTIQQEPSNGAHSCVGADSTKRLAT